MSESSPIQHAEGPPPFAQRRGNAWSRNVALIVAAIALAVSLWQWLEARREASRLQTELARRLMDSELASKEARGVSEQIRNTVRDIESRMGMLEVRVLETQNQRIALESLYQELARNRDEWVLAEIEQILITASQQLQLAGNVRSALIALEAADKRLASIDRPSLIPLRKVINRDAERLRALPSTDVPGIALKIDNLIASVDALGLLSEPVAARPVAVTSAPPQTWFSRLRNEVWRDLKDLFRIRVVEKAEVPLLAPEQSYFVRENLKLRLLSARVALLGRDEPAFRGDMTAAALWLHQYFDEESLPVRNALTLTKELSGRTLAISIPDITESLDAVRSQRMVRERAPR